MRQDIHCQRERDHDRLAVSIIPQMEIIVKQQLASTNRYCELLDLSQIKEFTVIQAIEQTHGIGQQGNHWESAPGENLTISLILKPTIAVADQFEITKILSLGISDALHEILAGHNHTIAIKWPNDIYVDGKKICGILVANKIRGNQIAASICGIGLNVNQTNFPAWVPNPTSLQLLTNVEYSPSKILLKIAESIAKRYYNNHNPSSREEDYLARLLYFNQQRPFIHLGNQINGRIVGVNRFGHLQIETDDGVHLSCQMKEVVFLP